MCTLSWVPLPQGYALAMNRDERRTRAPARPPALIQAGVPVLCPADAEAGGTWLAVNAQGHALALLNRYEDAPHDEKTEFVSRGLLVLELAGVPGPAALAAALEQRPLTRYRPFTLASLAPDAAPRLFVWNQRELESREVTEPGLLQASSGVAQAAAERERGTCLREAAARAGGLTPEVLAGLHRSHLPERGALSICMHRPDAVTVSFSLITVGPDLATFRYLAGAPCEDPPVTELRLPRTPTPR